MPSSSSFPPSELKSPRKAKKRILVVDDKASDSLLVKTCLEQTNDYVVREENNARTALATAAEFRPQLILLDVRMPGLDGGELAAALRASAELKAVPIVFLTSLVTKDEVAAGSGRLGEIPLLAKPIILSELIGCVNKHVGA
jgi:CheY-like chemotaxis protein